MTTDAQHSASDPAASVWVSASAGTGKTKVLTDRVLRLLLEGTAPSRILCITYTKAAAAEMSNRLNQELASWAVMKESSLVQLLEQLTGKIPGERRMHKARTLFAEVLDAPEGVKIETIHGFCQSLLRRFPIEAGLPPHFQVIDERTAAELLNEARLRLFSRLRHGEDAALAEAISALTGRFGEQGVLGLMEEIIGARRQLAGLMKEADVPVRLRRAAYRALNLAEGQTQAALFAEHFAYRGEEETELRAVCQALAQSATKTDQAAAQAMRAWLENPDMREVSLEQYQAVFLTVEKEPRKRLATKDTLVFLPAAPDILAREQRRVLGYVHTLHHLRTAEFSVYLAVLAEALLELYRHLKAMRGFLDYDDLILTARDLLHRPGIAPWVLFKLDGGLDHMLIDEAQDTSPEQWALVTALAEEFFSGKSSRETNRTLFVVGDEKQSIYRFQGAAPAEFDRMRRYFDGRIAEAGKTFRKLRLDLSFRSAEAVLRAVDAVFAQARARDGLDSSAEIIRHEAHRAGQAGRVEIWPLVEPEAEEELPAWSLPERRTMRRNPALALAHQIAQTIARWLSEETLLPAKGRPIVPGDVMILVRRRTGGFVDHLVRALKRQQIPVAGVDRMMLAENLAVMDMMALGQFALLPQDDLTLAVLLKSPLLGLSEEALFELAYDRGAKSLWQRLGEMRAENPDYARCREYLEAALRSADFMPPYEFFARMLESGEGRRRFAERLGEECFDPLDEFLAQALAYQKTHAASLQGFLHWLEAGRVQVKRDLDHGRGEVRIMTVHGAKGLQAPIVFLPDMAGLPAPNAQERLLWFTPAEDAGIFLCSLGGYAEGTLPQRLLEERRREDMREYRRLLYVAMTRAEDRLYLCGWRGAQNVSEDAWYSLAKDALVPLAEEHEALLFGEKTTIWRLENPQIAAAPCHKPPVQESLSSAPLPAFLMDQVPLEPVPPRPLVPSHEEEDTPPAYSPAADSLRFLRGRVLHRLLQSLPEIPPERQEKAALRFLLHHLPQLDAAARAQTMQETLQVIRHPEFAEVFGPGSQAEVPVSGIIEIPGQPPRVISGQIDRLAVRPGRVLIVDFKTDRTPPAKIDKVPAAYLAQMRAYAAALRAIYPAHEVYCALLWTAAPLLMPLPEPVLGGWRLKAAS